MKTKPNIQFNIALLTLISVSLQMVGCSNPVYTERDGPTAHTVDNVIRYGSIGAAGTGAYFATKAATGSTAAGAAAGVGGAGLMYGLHRFLDFKRRTAYRNGYEDGASQARADLVHETWQREAVCGGSTCANNGAAAPQGMTRRVYVPSRKINGVQYPGGYQTVQVIVQ